MNKHVTSLVLKFICYNKTIWKKQRKNFSEPETAIQKFPNARFYWKITLNRWRWLTYKYLTWWKHFSNFNTCMSWNYYELIKNSSFSRQTLIIIFKGKIIKDNMNTSTKEWQPTRNSLRFLTMKKFNKLNSLGARSSTGIQYLCQN